MKKIITCILFCTSVFLYGQEFYDFETGAQGWVTGNDAYTSLGATSIPSTWALSTATGGYSPIALGTTWYGTPNVGNSGAERSWIVSPVLTVNSTTVSINFDSYSSNEGGYPTYYDVEHVQVSINGAPFADIHGFDSQLHNYGDQTIRNITFSTSASVGDDIVIRFLYDTGDGCCGPGYISGWYVDNVAVTGASSCNLAITISQPTSPIYYGYAPMSCTTLQASSTGANGNVTYTWSMDTDPNDGNEFGTICATQPGCITVIVDAVDEAGCTSQATMLVEVVDVVCHDQNGVQKVQICHKPEGQNPNTLCVAASSVASHLAHGDVLGSCNAPAPCSSNKNSIANQGTTVRGQLDAIAISQPSNFKQNVSLENSRVQLYPNPAEGYTNISLHQGLTGMVRIEVYNPLGGLVLETSTEAIEGQRIQLNTTKLTDGLYQIHVVFGENQVYTQKLVVLKQSSK